MLYHYLKRFIRLNSLFLLAGGIMVSATAKMTRAEKEQLQAQIETLRKGDATFVIKNGNSPVEGATVKIDQIRHHFGFGGAITFKYMFPDTTDSTVTTDGAAYRNAFKKYFEWATPENCQKWPATDYVEGVQNYTEPDSLIAWCKANDITVRGHNLFWNQRMDWIPEWAQSLTGSEGKAAVDERIDKCLNHYKGRLKHWDIINELTHGQAGSGGNQGTLEVLTGDQGIFSYVLKEAAKIETESKFTLNEYNLVSQYSDREPFIAKVNQLIAEGCKIDIIGCEGHFGEQFDRNDFSTKLNDIAGRIDREIWMTEVDFSVSNAAGAIGDLMDVCFAHEKVGGIILWTFWQGNLWRETLTSYLVDKNFSESAMGTKWREKISEWTTNTTGTSDADGKVTFNGFYGKYLLTIEYNGITRHDTLFHEPGKTGDIKVAINRIRPAGETAAPGFVDRTIVVNHTTISFKLPAFMTGQLYLCAYSLEGKLVTRVPVTFQDGFSMVGDIPSGCLVYRIGTLRDVFHTTTGMNIE